MAIHELAACPACWFGPSSPIRKAGPSWLPEAFGPTTPAPSNNDGVAGSVHGNAGHKLIWVTSSCRMPKNRSPSTTRRGEDVINLTNRIDVNKYQTGHSDIVALMVLEHQIDALNYITRLRFEARLSKLEKDEKQSCCRCGGAWLAICYLQTRPS